MKSLLLSYFVVLLSLLLPSSSAYCLTTHNVKFFDVTEAVGLDVLVSAYGLSLGDWNNDQCLDLFIPSHGLPSHLFENDCQGKFIDRIEQFGTTVTYRLSWEDRRRPDRVFLAPSFSVKNVLTVDHETFLFHEPPRQQTSRPSYFIWRDLKTMAWHIRWSGANSYFTGNITWSLPAKVKTYGFEKADRIRSTSRSLNFASAANSCQEKGVSIFKSPFLRSDATVTFDLKINGEACKEDIYVGGIGANPWNERFSLGHFRPLWVKPLYEPGSDIGYFLWRTAADGIWHLRWSNNESKRLFHGIVRAKNGKITLIRSLSSEPQTHISSEGKGLQFSSKPHSGEAGFDFSADNWQRQGIFEVSAFIDDKPATIHAGAWSTLDGKGAIFSYGNYFGEKQFLFPSLSSVGLLVTPEFVGWRRINKGSSIFTGQISSNRTLENATFEPTVKEGTLEIKANKLTFTSSSSEILQKLRLEHGGLSPFGDRHAAAWGDLDNDGDVDLYISNGGGKGIGNVLGGELLENHGGMDFINEAIRKGVNDPTGRGRGVSIVDYDNDGFLDIFKANKGRPCRLFHNKNGSFDEVAEHLGIAGPFGSYPAISASWADVDSDGDMDLLLTSNPVRLFENISGMYFQDTTQKAGLEKLYRVHSANWGDYDNDGDLDLYMSKAHGITQLRSSTNALFRNNGDGVFQEVTGESRVGSSGNSRDAAWLDYDNDGDLDLYVVNTTSILSFVPWFARPFLRPWLKLLEWNFFDHSNVLYTNLGDGTFRDMTRKAATEGRGANSGVAVGDYNRDGFVDLFLSSGYYPLETGKVILYKNLSNHNHWIRLHLIGRKSNRSAVGAKVYLWTGSQVQFREFNGGIHGFSQDEPIIHFGLGKHETVDRLKVLWPSGKETMLEDLKVDQVLTIIE
jgi:hypothetical protein